MFAIRISNENRSKIEKCLTDEEARKGWYAIERYTFEKDYYYIRGYYSKGSTILWNAVLPGYIIRRDFEFDEDKIKTDWDQIVRK